MDGEILDRRAERDRGINHGMLPGDGADATVIGENDEDIDISGHNTVNLGETDGGTGEDDSHAGYNHDMPDEIDRAGGQEVANPSCIRPIGKDRGCPDLFENAQEGD